MIRSDYTSHQMYATNGLSVVKKRQILKDALSKSFEWWVDELDTCISYQRRKIDMSFDEILSKLDKKCTFTVIHRKGFKPKDSNDRWYLEFCFSTKTMVIQYLWIRCPEDTIAYFTDKYGLELAY